MLACTIDASMYMIVTNIGTIVTNIHMIDASIYDRC